MSGSTADPSLPGNRTPLPEQGRRPATESTMNTVIWKLLLTRLATAAGTLLFVATTVFVITSMLPGDVAQEILGQNATPEAVAALRSALGLDQPPLERFLSWLGGLMVGNPGVSLVN